MFVGSFIDIRSYNSFSPNLVFEVVAFLGLLLFFPSTKYSKMPLVVIFSILIYLFWQVFIFSYGKSVGTYYDFFIIHKVFFYLALLVFLGYSRVLERRTIMMIYHIVLYGMLVKYSISHIWGIDDRPGFFTENNFEVMLLLFLFISVLKLSRKIGIYDIFTLALIVLLSGSRSGILCLFSLLLFLDLSPYGIGKTFKLTMGSVVGALSVVVFLNRLGNLSVEDIDRFKFFLSFLNEVGEWGIYEWLVGNPSITPLSSSGASSLRYYYLLFSDYNANLAFSLVFHSFILRTIFDHGLIGLFFIYGCILWLLIRAHLNRSEILSVLSILLLNSISVSSINSVYALWGIIFVISASHIKANQKLILKRL